MKKTSLLVIVFGLFLGLPPAVFGADFDRIVIFGDSLSDNGNYYVLQNEMNPDPDYYYSGRYSNGPVWVEYLAGTGFLDCILEDKAYAGARTSGGSVPSLLSQVDTYINSTAQVPANALFVIWIGANDFISGSISVEDSVANIEAAMEDLALFGAENMLILNLPDLGGTPGVIALGYQTCLAATLTSKVFRNALERTVDDFKSDYPGLAVFQLDIYDLFQDIVADPGAFGFSNIDEISPNFSVADVWDNTAGYVFWDEIHPTTEAHAVIAAEAFDVLNTPLEDNDDSGGTGCFINSLF